jgi:hypothetical protein
LQKWFIALLVLGAAVALLNPLRNMAADRYDRAELQSAIIALAPQPSVAAVATLGAGDVSFNL